MIIVCSEVIIVLSLRSGDGSIAAGQRDSVGLRMWRSEVITSGTFVPRGGSSVGLVRAEANYQVIKS